MQPASVVYGVPLLNGVPQLAWLETCLNWTLISQHSTQTEGGSVYTDHTITNTCVWSYEWNYWYHAPNYSTTNSPKETVRPISLSHKSSSVQGERFDRPTKLNGSREQTLSDPITSGVCGTGWWIGTTWVISPTRAALVLAGRLWLRFPIIARGCRMRAAAKMNELQWRRRNKDGFGG